MPGYSVAQTGGSYSTLNAALTGLGDGNSITIRGEWTIDDTTQATIANDNITIECDAKSKHPGYWDESGAKHYRLVSSSGHALSLNGAYTVTIDGLCVEQSGTTASDECFRCELDSTDTVTLRNCIFRCSTNTNQQDCIYTGFNQDLGTLNLENCIIYGAGRAGINVQNFYGATSSGTINFNSCTIWNNGRDSSPGSAFEVGGGINIGVDNGDGSGFTINEHNSVVVENDTGGSSGGNSPADHNEVVSTGTGIGTWNVSYSIDSDGSISSNTDGGTGNLASRTATDSSSPGTGDWVVFEDITSSPYDLRLQDNAENDAQDAHTTATAHSITIPTLDVWRTSRPYNTSYDIGAHEIGPSVFSIVQTKTWRTSDAANITVSFDSAITSGNLIAIALGAYSPGTTDISVSDSVNGSWTQLYDNEWGADSFGGIFYFPNSSSGSPNITITFTGFSSTNYLTYSLIEISGVVTTSPVNASNQNDATSSSWSSGNITTDVADCFLFGVASQDSANNWLNQGDDWFLLGEEENYTQWFPVTFSARIIASTVSSFDFDGTIEASQPYWAAIVAFEAPVTVAVKDVIGSGIIPTAR